MSVPAWASVVLLAAMALIILGYWTYRAVEGSLRELRAATLASMLDTQVRSLEIWIENRKIDMRRIARDQQVRSQVEALAKIAARAASASDEYCSAPARRPLVEQLAVVLEEQGAVAFNATDRARRIIASRFREHCGLRLREAAFERDLAPVFKGQTRFVRPYAPEERFEASPKKPLIERPVTWFETPVLDAAGNVIASLGFAEYADGQFGGVLAAARTGETGEAYAFERNGRLLSQPRFAVEAPASSPIAAHVVAQGAQGSVLDPYRSYHGGEVIGAWRWLDQHDFGIAVELGAAEAYAPLRYLNIAFGVVFGALVIAVFAALVSAWSVVRLKKERGRRAGPYRLGERIGEGGMANIYLAQHDLLKRPTAVKLMKPHRATDEMIARFEREAQLASSLSHPNTVEIFDYGHTRDGLFYYAMEYLDGMTVSQVLERQNPIPVARAIHILRQVCAALAEAHARDIIHRDIKPENIMVCRYGGAYDFVKVLDFGLVKHISEKHSRDLTRALRILGTPLYMAPERLRNPADVDARTDIYAVGALAFLMLTGRKLFDSTDDLELTSKILNEEPPRAAAVAPQPVPMELDLIVTSCVEKKRELRPQRVADLVEAFDALALEHRWTQREAQEWWNTIMDSVESAVSRAKH